MTKADVAATREWSDDLTTATPAAHVMVTYFDQEIAEWIVDIIPGWDVVELKSFGWTHWRDLPPNPWDEMKAKEAPDDGLARVTPEATENAASEAAK